jgi:hypothetical protein
MDLQPIAIMLQLMRPTRTGWRFLGDSRLKAAGAFNGLPRELRNTMQAI